MPGFDKRDYPLVAARVAEWHGWVFVNASGDAPALDEYVGNLDELVAPWEIDRMFVAASHDYVINANWKTITENYHECYHCPSIHPALCVVTPAGFRRELPARRDVGGRLDGAEGLRRDDVDRRGESGGVRIRGLDDRQAREVYYFGLFPNLLISLHPDYVMAHRFEPICADRRRRSSASGCSRPRPRDVPASRPTTRASSGTSRTARTGWRASR